MFKADRTSAQDPETSAQANLFHPVQQVWQEHFKFEGTIIKGLTPTGRATVAALDLNSARRRRIRSVEQKFRLFPPRDL